MIEERDVIDSERCVMCSYISITILVEVTQPLNNEAYIGNLKETFSC